MHTQNENPVSLSPDPLTTDLNPKRSSIKLTEQMQNPPQLKDINSLNSIFNEFPIHSLNDYYDIENSQFKKRIDKLNLKFCWESESLSSQEEIPKPYNKLFIILFKEINLYTEEIERLNNIIKEKNKNEKYFKDKVFEFTQKEKDRILTKQMLKNYQKTIKLLEKKITEKIASEEKLKSEIEKMKQQMNFSKDNIQSNLSSYNQICNSPVATSKAISYLYNSTNNYKNQKNDLSSIKRSSNSIENKSKEKKKFYTAKGVNSERRVVNNKKKSERGKGYLNNLIVVGDNKNESNCVLDDLSSIANMKDSLVLSMAYNDTEIINKCIEHYKDEIDNLNKIEVFLEKQKQQIKDIYNKNNVKF